MEQSATSKSAAERGDLTARFRRPNNSIGRLRFIDRESIDTFCERGILGTVIAILAWGPLATGATRTSQFLVMLGLGVLLIAFWAVRIWVRDQYRFLFPPFGWVVLGFTGYAIWRYTGADVEYDARLELLQILLYAVMFFAILDNLTSQENLQILLFTLIGLGLLLSCYAVFQYLTDSQKVLWFDKPKVYRGRGSATYICPNHLVGYLEMVLPVALAYTIIGRHKPLMKIGIGYAAVVIIAGIAVTVSRGGYLAVVASMAVFFLILLWNRDFRIPAIAVVMLLVIAAVMFGKRSYQAQQRFENLEQPLTNMRPHYWKAAAQMWQDNFWFGVGPQQYDWRFRQYRHPHVQGRPVQAHNDYLNTLADYGTIGGAIVGAGLMLLAWGVVRSWKYVQRSNQIATRTSNRSAVVLGCSIGLLAIAFHSAVDFNMHIPANAAVAVALMAILTSHQRFATERFWLKPGVIGRIFGTLVLLAAAGYLVLQLSRLGPQTYLLNTYPREKTFESRINLIQKALKFDPNNGLVLLAAGDLYRETGWETEDENLIRAAMPWYERGIALNRWNPYNYLYLGMCLDWLKEHEKAAPHFAKAREIDPNGSYTVALNGWHKLQLNDLHGAKADFWHSIELLHHEGFNNLAKSYLQIVERRIAEQAGPQ
ncbi:MAG TPA: O-antigen ligase family protein [Verrucomicrobiae bacterium]